MALLSMHSVPQVGLVAAGSCFPRLAHLLSSCCRAGRLLVAMAHSSTSSSPSANQNTHERDASSPTPAAALRGSAHHND